MASSYLRLQPWVRCSNDVDDRGVAGGEDRRATGMQALYPPSFCQLYDGEELTEEGDGDFHIHLYLQEKLEAVIKGKNDKCEINFSYDDK